MIDYVLNFVTIYLFVYKIKGFVRKLSSIFVKPSFGFQIICIFFSCENRKVKYCN